MNVQLWNDMMVLLKNSNGRMLNYAVMLHKLMGGRKLPGREFIRRSNRIYFGSLRCLTLEHFVAFFVNAAVM